jgi:acylphosphatase
VRCVAEGPRERLVNLEERLREGPPSAIVERVSVAWMPGTGTLGPFGVRSGGHRGD